MKPQGPDLPSPEPDVHRSMGLCALLQDMREDCRYSILDLGPALGTNVAFWSRFQCKLYFEDFYSGLLEEQPQALEEESWDEPLLGRILPLPPGTEFDVVLCWDLLNYLKQDHLQALIRYLTRFCRPGTSVFAMLWLTPEIPERPMRFRILDSEHMAYERESAATKPGSGYQPRDIGKLMHEFHAAGSFLLRHGVQEYLFTYNRQGSAGCP
ncbi:MAG: class I SAM-dependent methyltransferase [Acidobacteria bacterium]|nr:class I SAM-dependent methyltransferase [Acidobacteriota bacterium]